MLNKLNVVNWHAINSPLTVLRHVWCWVEFHSHHCLRGGTWTAYITTHCVTVHPTKHLYGLVLVLFWLYHAFLVDSRSVPHNSQGCFCGSKAIDPFHKSHKKPIPYPTVHHFVAEMYTLVHISATKWRIVGYQCAICWIDLLRRYPWSILGGCGSNQLVPNHDKTWTVCIIRGMYSIWVGTGLFH